MNRIRHASAQTRDRERRRRVRAFRVDLATKQWCDLWHWHVDLEVTGTPGPRERRRHIGALLEAFRRARIELSRESAPHQLFATLHPRHPADDAVWVHTPNPNGTPFPISFEHAVALETWPPMLAGRLDRTQYGVRRIDGEDDPRFVILLRDPIHG